MPLLTPCHRENPRTNGRSRKRALELSIDDVDGVELEQLQQVRQMGPLSQILDLMPGLGQLAQGVTPEVTDQQFKHIEAIILSMTPEERRNPRILNSSRKKRIARGSGTTVQEVIALLKQFHQMQRMMKQLGKGKGGMQGLMRIFG